MNRTLRRIIILGIPAVLGILEIFHPTFAGFEVANSISPKLNWWITLHILQLPLFCLLALSVYLLLDGIKSKWAILSKVALGIFVAFYPALDAILGIGSGILVRYIQGTVGIVQAATQAALDHYFTSDLAMLVGIIGAGAWAMAILSAILALSRPVQWRWPVIMAVGLAALAILYFQLIRFNLVPTLLSVDNWSRLILLLAVAVGLLVRPHLAGGLLVMAAYFFSVDHAPPTGPVALACYFVAALQLEFFPEKAPLVKQDVASLQQDAVSSDDMTLEGDKPLTSNATSRKELVPKEDVIAEPS